MNDFAKFATRFHKLKENLQELEALEFARLTSAEEEAKRAWHGVDEMKRQVGQRQSQVLNATVWQDYERHQAFLEHRKNQLAEQWAAVKHLAEQQQVRVQAAYVEEKTWSHVATEAVSMWQLEEARKAQVEADDDALRRYRKADL